MNIPLGIKFMSVTCCGLWAVGCGLWPDTVLAECSMLKAADCWVPLVTCNTSLCNNLHKLLAIFRLKWPKLTLTMFCELDLKSLWRELDEYDIEIESETKKLQEVWVRIAELKEENETTTIGYKIISF